MPRLEGSIGCFLEWEEPILERVKTEATVPRAEQGWIQLEGSSKE